MDRVVLVMRRSRILLLAGAFALTLGIVLARPCGPSDPVYHGKRLSQWLAETSPGKQLTDEAIQAVRAIGTNALPYLVCEFERDEAKWLERIKQGKFVSQTLGIRFEPKWVRKGKVMSALASLGADAAPALPTYARYFDDPERGVTVVSLVNLTRQAGLPFLLKALSSTNVIAADYAIQALRFREEKGDLELPVILALMNHDNQKARAFATSVLRYHPPMVGSNMTVLRRALSDPAPSVRRNAIKALSVFSTEA